MRSFQVLLAAGLVLLAVSLGSIAGGAGAQGPSSDPKSEPFTRRPPSNAPGVRPALVGTPVVPCSDPDGCPDLYVHQASLNDRDIVVRTFSPNSCAVREGYAQPGQNLLLRFNFTTPNLGPGDLIIGAPADHPEWFDFDNCHNHSHFREYADYRLWTAAGYQAWSALREANPGALPATLLAEHPELRPQLVEGKKFGFCVIDFLRFTVPGAPLSPVYSDCENNQGISVGWADSYTKQTDGQWFDITNVPDGAYVIEAEVNAERFFTETNYANNAAALPITLAVPTQMRIPTRTPTQTSTPLAGPSPTPTRAVGQVGGRNLSLRAPGAALSWLDGTVETGYLVVRWSPNGTAFIPADGSQLSASATSTTDPLPPSDYLYCYAVLPMIGASAVAVSDLLCRFPSSASGAAIPGQFTIRLDQSNLARLSWAPPGGQSAYLVFAVTFDGRPARAISVPDGQTSIMDDTGGAVTCYVVQALAGTTVLGTTDALCGVPGVSTLGPASAGAVSQALERARGAFAGAPRPR